MKISELFESVVDATDRFQRRKEQNLRDKESSNDYFDTNIISKNVKQQINQVIAEKIKEAKTWLNDEMKRYRFAVSSFSGKSIDSTQTTALFLPLFDESDENHDKAVAIVKKYKPELLQILGGYTEKLKEVAAEARNKSEKLTMDWRNANELLIAAGINRLFDAAYKLYTKIKEL